MRGSTAGLSVKGKSSVHYALLTVLDTLFATLIVTPLVVGYWRSVWGLMDLYLYPDDDVISGLASTAIGVGGHMVFTLNQFVLTRNFFPDKNRIAFYAVSRLYTVVFGVVCVNGWRGPWHLLHFQSKTEINSIIATTIVAVVALAATRTIRNIVSTPFGVCTDNAKGYFDVITMFRVSVSFKILFLTLAFDLKLLDFRDEDFLKL